MEENKILIISAIVAIAILISWFKMAANIKKIINKLEENKSIEYCKNEAEIAAFSGNNDEAQKWFCRALFYEAQGLNDYTTDEAKKNRVDVLKSEYLDKIKDVGGNWPESL